ncbi:autotransporter outer membrane beta-barrel domain-containing protein [Cupriavidus alkaliphilus]|uniref:autotransporter outer membrane beta-barrel domain-containing protein n=1 Tax=Cupriavidus alkaliphilus TaxID=942866 RepID=UPI000DC56A65|nr:autotransporter outer membrane beta-barrel domain-containing protein [Cupriavidus alkaliphilus]RAS03500.1 outer membrane autotransporter protein [Cupriavidus alkaliphilus]
MDKPSVLRIVAFASLSVQVESLLAQTCPSPVIVNGAGCTVPAGTTVPVAANTVGLSANGAGGSIVGNGITINLGGASAVGASAAGGASILFDGSVVDSTSATAAATNRQVGLRATGAESEVSATGSTIDLRPTAGAPSLMVGASAENGGAITLTDTTVQMAGGTGGSNHGVQATGMDGSVASTVTIAGGSITTEGRNAYGLLASAGGAIKTNASGDPTSPNPVIRTTGQGSHALVVTGTGSRADITGTALSAENATSRGLSVAAGGMATLTRSTVFGNVYGAYVDGAESLLELVDSTVSTARDGGHGVRGVNTTVTLTRGAVSTTGAGSISLWATAGTTVTVDGTVISATGGGNAMGIVVDADSTVTMTGGSVSTTGGAALAARKANAALSTTNTIVRTTGDYAYGAVADYGGTATVNGGSIDTSGAFAIGLYAIVEPSAPTQASTLQANGVVIRTDGARAYGALAQQGFLPGAATVMLTDSSVATQAADAIGLRAISGGSIVSNRTQVQTLGTAAHGALARFGPSSVSIDGGSVAVSGANAHGTVAEAGGRISGAGTSVIANGVGGSALFAIGEAASPSSASFGNSTLSNVDGPTIGVAGAADIALTGTTVQGSGQWLKVGAATDFLPLTNPGAEPPGTVDPVEPAEPGPDLLAVQDATTALPVRKLPMLDPSVPGAANIVLSGSTVTGSAATLSGAVSNVTMQSGSLWNLTGSSNLSLLTNDASRILFSAPVGGAFKTLTVNGYEGTNGALIGLHTELAGDSAPSDKLIVDGGAATGQTGLRITNAGGTGAVTQGNGILVVDAVNGGTTAPAAFALDGRAVAGAYEYRLFRGSTDASNPDAWYLRSERIPTPPVPPDPDPVPIPLFRPEVAAYLANQRLAGQMFVHSLHDRLGEPQYVEGQDFNREQQEPRSGWLRAVGKWEGSHSRDGNFKVDTDAFLLHGGLELADWNIASDTDRLHGGVMASYGTARSDAEAAGNAARATGKVEGFSLGAYGTWYQNDENKLGAYVDTWFQYGWFDNKVEGDQLPTVKYDAQGWAMSGEVGYAMPLRGNWVIEPQAQLIYVDYSDDDFTEPNGTRISGADSSGLITRLGARLHRTSVRDDGRKLQPYLTLNWWHTSTDSSVSFNQLPLGSMYPSNRYEVKLGINVDMRKRWTSWANVAGAWGRQSFHQYALRMGVKYTW